ncbi:MAG TPA: hypothetical protein VFA41_20520 [Ktedonobacteraceae bacterium]|nr:hypothetical protein [Ktedonobacteraceae bacterium]
MKQPRSPVILSAAKDLALAGRFAHRYRRSFAALRMTSGGRLVMACHETAPLACHPERREGSRACRVEPGEA